MKIITFDYTPPVFLFLFSKMKIRKEQRYGNNTLGGGLSFTS